MSAYFTIYAKSRKAPEEAAALELMCLCTTPARELASQFNLNYDECTDIKDVDFLKKIRDYYKNEYDCLMEVKEKGQKRALLYRDMATKAANVEVLNELLEKANDEEDGLKEIEEDANFAYMRYSRVALLCCIYEDNCDEYEFYYYFG